MPRPGVRNLPRPAAAFTDGRFLRTRGTSAMSWQDHVGGCLEATPYGSTALKAGLMRGSERPR